jgi:hypothetical protein
MLPIFLFRPRVFPLARFVFAVGLAMASVGSANCGLDHCPIGFRPDQAAKWALGFSWRMVTYKQGGEGVGFQQGTARLEWRPTANSTLGAELPVSAPLTESRFAYGISNPLLFAEAAVSSAGGSRFSLGTQVELPYGDVSKGFASEHAMGVVFASAGRAFGNYSLSSRLGWSTSIPYHASQATDPSPYDHPLGGHAVSAHVSHSQHLPGGATSFVEPHSSRDLLFRIEASRRFPVGTTSVNLNGAHAMEPGFAPENALSGGVSVDVPFGERYSIRPEIRFPLTQPSRFESAGGVGIRRAF